MSNRHAVEFGLIFGVILVMLSLVGTFLFHGDYGQVDGLTEVSDGWYFLKNGEIQEHGKHEELMQKDGEYRHLYESQMALENYGRQVNRDV